MVANWSMQGLSSDEIKNFINHKQTFKHWLWTTALVCLLDFPNLIGTTATTESETDNSLEYQEHFYRTDQLCPNLQESVEGKEIDTANLPYKSVFRFKYHPNADNFQPCIIEANGPHRWPIEAHVEAVHVDSRPWNFSGAGKCEEHIKLRLPEPSFFKKQYEPQIICRISKEKDDDLTELGYLFHPYLWRFPRGKLGISFSSFNLSLVQQILLERENKSVEDSPILQTKNYWLDSDPDKREFVQIVFTTRHRDGYGCSLRVQQYLVDDQNLLCDKVKQHSPFQLCGLYPCSKREVLLKTIKFWSPVQKNVYTSNTPLLPQWNYSGHKQSFLTYVRVLIMPILFLGVVYVSRKVRLRIANRYLARHGGTLIETDGRSRNIFCPDQHAAVGSLLVRPTHELSEPGSHSPFLNNTVCNVPVGLEEYPWNEDFPPPYDSIDDPCPSYLEATSTKSGQLS